MEDPGGSEQSNHGGWTFAFDRGPQGNQYKLDETLEAEALLLGRVTYEGFAAFWPSLTGEFADKYNAMSKYVVSSTSELTPWNNSTVLDGSVPAEVSKLKLSLDGNILVHGSAQLVTALLAHQLVDELRLMVFPIVLGSGKRLFGAAEETRHLGLVDHVVVGDGVIILTYRQSAS
jgi:dihydrofolate reductase